MSKDPRKAELKKAWREKEREKLTASLPLPIQDLKDLLDHLDQEGAAECDHTLRETTAFLQARSLDVDRVIPWLQDHGGFCDCEVLANVEDVADTL